MGFRTNAFATVWEVDPVSPTHTKARISISHKDRQTGEYVNDFGGYVSFFGTAAAGKAALLNPKDRIKLGDVDATTKYVKEKNITYYNFNIYSFEVLGRHDPAGVVPNGSGYSESLEQDTSFMDVDSGEIEEELPF